MNQIEIQELTTHLSQALDQNYDVVNMDAVLYVICALEGTTITKEQLEATRLAKYINQLRRRTKNEHLARRAKSLLKKWREMVGIQQTATEYLAHPSQISPSQPALNLVKSPINSFITEPIAPSQQIVSDMHSNIDSAEPPLLGEHTLLHPNFSNLVNSIKDSDRHENIAITTFHTHKDRRHSHAIRSCHVASPQPIVIDHSINSVINLTEDSTVKINETSVVIDIASDSDENDNNSSLNPKKLNSIVPAPLPTPSTPSSRQRKLKKEKRSKEREGQVATNTRFGAKVSDTCQQAALTTDSEIFSLSNSSMSSIVSGDATLSYSQNKSRLNSNELTFTGRFKAVDHLFRSTESGKRKIDEYSAYDSNASCSRLSPSTVDEVKKAEHLFDAQLTNATANQMPMSAVGYESNTRHEYLESESPSQIPKRRGRKKGSKGVDALIAKESSSLSQQIFFGGSVKKVKTTKELFNEIQSRKLSVSMQSSASNLSNSSTNRDLTSHTTFPRQTSSCSDTSMHSPHILETLSGSAIFASKIDDLANTDSDTVTSDPSHDSNKSQEIKECTSLDSNSNSVQSLPLANNRENLIPKNVNDITTQLMHLIHSLNSPLSIIEIERVYQEKIIPCTCIVIEEVEGTLGESNNCTLDDQSKNAKISLNSKDNLSCHNRDNFPTSQRSINGEVIDTQPKLVKSIFDLDFDDNDDPLNLIMDEIQKPIARAEELKNNKSDTKNIHFGASAQNVSFNINFSDDAQQDNSNQEREKSETQNAIPAFTVHEDPDCLARQRFYIQTNKVTSFHINALHNYYIPNINGNWDSVESFTSFQPKHTIIDTMESYTVTNGADVVPKYGLLTSDRIRKDLSSLKSIKPYRVKKFTSFFSPFLGVAKCLPTCRRARRRLKNFVTLSTANDNTAKNFESLENMKASFKNCNPLNVKIDGTTSAIYSHNENHVPMQVNTNVEQLPPSQSFSGNAISYNLLKLADDKVRDDEISDKSSNHGCQENSPFSSSSSSGYSDSKEDQHNIIKNQQNKSIQLNSRNSDMNRRKRRIYLEDDSKKKKHYRKRIKAAVNGTCSNLHRNLNSSDSENGMENDYKNEYGNSNNEEYAIVQRPAGDGENCRNHIVLTIKKTPSKINSPANSMNAFSPSTTSDAANLKKSILDFCLEDTNISQSITEIPQKEKEDLSKSNRIVHQSRCSAYRRIFRKSDKSQTNFIDLELKHLFHLKSNPPCILANSKLHNKLFFPHELSRDNTSGIRERIINYSSSSSSSYDDDSEVENTSFVKKANVKKFSAYNNHNLKIETETCAATAISEFKFESDEDSMLTSLGDSDIDIQDGIHATNDSVDYCNDFQNNKMLESFNSIFVDSLRTNRKNASGNMESSPHITSLESLKPEDVDAITRYCNNNNLGVNLSNELSNISAKSIKSLDSTEKLPSLGIEHCTGIKTSSDLASTSIADKKLTRIQQFKEWHQVLQLKSYNNEPLIVLPYVLLE
ncbi:mediator of RNA polymerase II transcription subunit 26 [Drosophila sechellia]|uniref:Mediator of RNA polymerase II transcription subunit 26 n=1 Tax=Drosophila sechellia TaxID=7238 RepID=B4IIY9_DROSE|nr:mediator of RNA polymerase II transcription subunit 26 [Drosophila sechellia]XP_032579962.1 mediator of RNA polymerase II transcription subunit 26 [Drosophila sechellia]XP_032579963.1 mediator of RNA polymerase II transcription subunit 26 [Drosophila sechellia]EDW50930.1 GM26770 [Drosophila sechellia]